MPTCDKCSREVPPHNDATYLSAILYDDPIEVFACSARHLLPVVVNGEVVCTGSPSRAQYIEGQPRDDRSEFPYNSEFETKFRDAYYKLLQT